MIDRDELKPCPSCPDGYVWNAEGPTGAKCKTCDGFAIVHLDGSPLTPTEKKEFGHD